VESRSVRHDDGTVESFQRGLVGSRLAPAELERLYWDEIRRLTLGAVSFSRGAIRVAGLWPALLRFGPLVDGRRAISGGVFARRPGGTIGWRADTEATSVNVEGFAPLLRGPFWRLEAWLHNLVARRFFSRLERGRR
jgi:hypothetical protein